MRTLVGTEFGDLDQLWLLNQYRAAEIRGAGAIMRLSNLADDSRLRHDLSRHLRDEAVHAWLWTRAIEDLGGDITDVEDPYQARLGANFGVPKTFEELLAVTLVSESRGLAQYESHLSDESTSPAISRVLRGILKDERWHVSYIEQELETLAKRDSSVSEAIARAEAADEAAMAEIQVLAESTAAGSS